MKKTIRFVFFFMMVLGLFFAFQMMASAEIIASGYCGDTATWTLDDEGTFTVSGEGETYGSANYAEYIKNIRKVVFENGITRVGKRTFMGCPNLETVVFSETITEIDEMAFELCPILTDVEFCEGLKIIDNYAFLECSKLADVQLPSSLTSVYRQAFGDCIALEEIFIPENVDSSLYLTFEGCSSLKAVHVDADNERLFSVDGVLFRRDAFDADLITLVLYPAAKDDSFYMVPEYVSIIDEHAFSQCDLTTVILPDKLTTICAYAFSECGNMKSIYIPKDVTEIQYDIFRGSPLEAIHVDEENTAYTSVDGVLYSKDMKTLICIPKGKKDRTFTIPSEVETVLMAAFTGNNRLVEVIVSENVQALDISVLPSNLKSVYILNPDCVLSNTAGEVFTKASFYGYAGSTVQAYCEEENISFYSFYEDVDYTFANGILTVTEEELPILAEDEAFIWEQYGGKTNVIILDNVSLVTQRAFMNFDIVSMIMVFGDLVKFETNAFVSDFFVEPDETPQGYSATPYRFVVFFSDAEVEASAFKTSFIYYIENGKICTGIKSYIHFSYDAGIVSFDDEVLFYYWDLFNMIAAMSLYYEDVQTLHFKYLYTVDMFYYEWNDADHIDYTLHNALANVDLNAYIYDEDAELVPISFTELYYGINDLSIDGFKIFLTDNDNMEYEGPDVHTNTNIAAYFLRAIVILLNKILSLFNRT